MKEVLVNYIKKEIENIIGRQWEIDEVQGMIDMLYDTKVIDLKENNELENLLFKKEEEAKKHKKHES